MATYSFNKNLHATLAAGVIDTVTMATDFDQMEIINLSANPLYFKVNATTDFAPRDADTEILPGHSAAVVRAPGRKTTVKLVSAVGGDYSVAAR